MLSLTACPSTTRRTCHLLSEASLSQGHTQGHRAGGWAGRTSSARTEKPSSLAHAEVETSFLPEAGDFLGEGRLQHPCCSGKDPSRGSHKSSCVTGFPKQMGCLGSAACRGFGENVAPQNTCPRPIANTRHMHSPGKRPREKNLFLWSDKGCQMGCQHTWEVAAAFGCQQVSSGVLQD